MSIRRLIAAAAAMALTAVALAALTPGRAELTDALTAPQRTADTLGPEALVIALTGVVAWAAWTWGALGLVLTAGSALPGVFGFASRCVLQVLLPAGARHSAAVLLGLGVGVAVPLLPVLPTVGSPPTASAAPAGDAVPDWPAVASAADPVPDWPVGAPVTDPVPAADRPGAHVVVRGDCLWHLAEDRLAADHGGTPSAGEISTAVDAWWTANADVIGADPDLLLPGQVLQQPDAS